MLSQTSHPYTLLFRLYCVCRDPQVVLKTKHFRQSTDNQIKLSQIPVHPLGSHSRLHTTFNKVCLISNNKTIFRALDMAKELAREQDGNFVGQMSTAALACGHMESPSLPEIDLRASRSLRASDQHSRPLLAPGLLPVSDASAKRGQRRGNCRAQKSWTKIPMAKFLQERVWGWKNHLFWCAILLTPYTLHTASFQTTLYMSAIARWWCQKLGLRYSRRERNVVAFAQIQHRLLGAAA
jgi:hypothetical protein